MESNYVTGVCAVDDISVDWTLLGTARSRTSQTNDPGTMSKWLTIGDKTFFFFP
jgi:hypothetical protein